MEWKKENMSASELERRQKEYMNAALGMMKRAKTDVSVHSVHNGESNEQTIKTVQNVPAAEIPDEEEHEAVETDHDDAPGVEDRVYDKASDEMEDTDDGKYGVYTADELLSAEQSNESLKKAAEILEEMTRSTEYMKKLASGSRDEDDMPETEEIDCDDAEGSSFREEDGENGTDPSEEA